MAKAISHVMPNTNHRLCPWHIMQNALKHVNNVFKGPGGVQCALSMFMESIEEEDEFLSAWDAMLEEYDVHDNNWLKSIFELREKWTYAYNKQAWSAGINNTELSESFNASLKDYLGSDFSVAQFFMHFDRVVNDKRYKELEAKLKSGLEIAFAKKRKLSNRQLHSQMSQAHIQYVHAVNSTLPPSMVLHPYSVEQPPQGYNVPNLVPCLPYEPSQQTSFQDLLHQNLTGCSFTVQDSQASNSNVLF
ncbi:hypothetical protein WN944_023508 [Citrus x changshan-huyou]|uniref:Protein FAR1-RELATED SEQUENCE n=1 Tax=Citrus x changshan-huyou TaxID=2935761 RepID=A0AAP0N0E8_9ROSI